MKQGIIISILLVSLIGCGVGVMVPKKYIKWGEKVCEKNGGLESIYVYNKLFPNAHCKNGATFRSHGEDFKLKRNP